MVKISKHIYYANFAKHSPYQIFPLATWYPDFSMDYVFENECKQAGIESDSETMQIIKVWYFVYVYIAIQQKITLLYIVVYVYVNVCGVVPQKQNIIYS